MTHVPRALRPDHRCLPRTWPRRGAASGTGMIWLALAGRDVARLRKAHPDSDHPLVVSDASTADCAASLPQQCQQQHRQPPDALAHYVGFIVVAPVYRTTPEQYRGCMDRLSRLRLPLVALTNALRATKRPGAAVFVYTAAAPGLMENPGSSQPNKQPARPRGRSETVSAARPRQSLETGQPDGLAVVAGRRPDQWPDLFDGRRLRRHPAAGSLTHRH